MGFGSQVRRLGRSLRGESQPDGRRHPFVGDPRFDSWDVVRDFETIADARAWRQNLEERGVEAVLTADWPLDRFGRGDIALRVPPGRWSEAEELLGDYDL